MGKIKKFFSQHIFMPRRQLKVIYGSLLKAEKLCEKDLVFRAFYERALNQEMRELAVKKLRFIIVASLIVAVLFLAALVRWALPRLFAGQVWTFVFEALILIIASGILFAVIRSQLSKIFNAYLGAIDSSARKTEEYKKAEEESDQAKYNGGPLPSSSYASDELKKAHIRESRKRHANIDPGAKKASSSSRSSKSSASQPSRAKPSQSQARSSQPQPQSQPNQSQARSSQFKALKAFRASGRES